MSTGTKRGFSLFELLIVVAVIATLLALLIPTVGVIREASRSAVCQSNFRQMYLGIAGYTQDWRGLMPPVGGWGQTAGYPQLIGATYLESERLASGGNSGRDVLKCPADRRPLGSPGAAGNSSEGPDYMPAVWDQGSIHTYERLWSSYATSQAAFTPWGAWINTSQRLVAIPSSRAMMWDSPGTNSVAYPNFFLPAGANRHRTGLNMMIADGRVQWYDFAPLRHGENWETWFWDPNGDWLRPCGSMGGLMHVIGANYGVANLNPNEEPWR